MNEHEITIRPANVDDLDAINQVIRAAIELWRLPERVMRLALPSYLYSALDLRHLQIAVAVTAQAGRVIAVAALESDAEAHLPDQRRGLLLHGLYIDPQLQRRGIGHLLIDWAMGMVVRLAREGLLIKAQPQAVPFFERIGMQPLAVSDDRRDYTHRFRVPRPVRQA